MSEKIGENKKKIAVIASSRATYGYKRKLIGLINNSQKLDLQLIVTGMHLMKDYGDSIDEIQQDGYPIISKLGFDLAKDTPADWAKSIGKEIYGLAEIFEKIKPDIVLATGDRGEMFAVVATAAYMNLPIAHIQSGDVSGHIDGSARHAMTKLSHIHFAACEDSANRVIKMGEEPWRVFNVGAPQLDEIIHSKKIPKKDLEKILKLNLDKKPLLVIQHPVLVENENAYFQMKETIEALNLLKHPSIIVYPNIDSGGKNIINAIREDENLPFIHTYKNIDRKVFMSLLGNTSAIVGNSSCGILEAPSFKLPAINIGNRQRGRMQAINVINVGYKSEDIHQAIKKALYDDNFRNNLKTCENPYGDGFSSERILKILEEIPLHANLLDKKITY